MQANLPSHGIIHDLYPPMAKHSSANPSLIPNLKVRNERIVPSLMVTSYP